MSGRWSQAPPSVRSGGSPVVPSSPGGRFRPFVATVAFGEPVLGERVARDDARQDAQTLDPDPLLFVAQLSLPLHTSLPRAPRLLRGLQRPGWMTAEQSLPGGLHR